MSEERPAEGDQPRDRQEHDDRGGVAHIRHLRRLHADPVGDVVGQHEVEEEQESDSRRERCLFCREGQGHESGRQEEELVLARRQVAPHEDDDAEGPERRIDILAREAAVVHQRRRKRDQGRRGQRPERAQLPAQQEWHQHEQRAHRGCQDAALIVAVPEDRHDRAVADELERPVHERHVFVGVAGAVEGEEVSKALREAVAEEAVEALVVVVRARAQIPEAQDGGAGGDDGVSADLPVPGGQHGDALARLVVEGERTEAFSGGPAVGYVRFLGAHGLLSGR